MLFCFNMGRSTGAACCIPVLTEIMSWGVEVGMNIKAGRIILRVDIGLHILIVVLLQPHTGSMAVAFTKKHEKAVAHTMPELCLAVDRASNHLGSI